MTLPPWLAALEQVVVDAAAVATVVAVWFAWKAVRDSEHTAKALKESLDLARSERDEKVRARAALVLQHSDLLSSRLSGVWLDGLAYDVLHPSEESLDSYLREIEQDIGWANGLLDRASQVDPELTAYAELVWRKIMAIRLSLRVARTSALAATARLVDGQEQRLKEKWKPYRHRVLQLATQAVELLARMETSFPKTAVTVQGLDRQAFLKKTDAEVEAMAKPRVEQLLEEVDRPGSTAGE